MSSEVGKPAQRRQRRRRNHLWLADKIDTRTFPTKSICPSRLSLTNLIRAIMNINLDISRSNKILGYDPTIDILKWYYIFHRYHGNQWRSNPLVL